MSEKVRVPGSTLSADPEKQRAWRERSARRYAERLAEEGRAPLARYTELRTYTRLGPNEERRARLEERDYGPKAYWIRTEPSYVSGRPAPSVAAHPDTRGSGGHAEALVPFHAEEEIDWHALVGAKWEDKYGRSKQDCRDAAPLYEAEWRRMLADGRAVPFIARWEEDTGRTWGAE